MLRHLSHVLECVGVLLDRDRAHPVRCALQQEVVEGRAEILFVLLLGEGGGNGAEKGQAEHDHDGQNAEGGGNRAPLHRCSRRIELVRGPAPHGMQCRCDAERERGRRRVPGARLDRSLQSDLQRRFHNL